MGDGAEIDMDMGELRGAKCEAGVAGMRESRPANRRFVHVGVHLCAAVVHLRRCWDAREARLFVCVHVMRGGRYFPVGDLFVRARWPVFVCVCARPWLWEMHLPFFEGHVAARWELM